MKCPYCPSSETKVIDKRDTEDNNTTRRRRECLKCQKRFTTYERAEITLSVIKKDGRREEYNRDKLLSGLKKACEKRDVGSEVLETTTSEIESELRNLDQKEIQSKKVGSIVMRKLKKIDKVAYIRFASVYKDFDDIKSFEEEVKKLKK